MTDQAVSTAVQLEALTTVGSGTPRATSTALEVLSSINSPVVATAMALEVMVRSYSPVALPADDTVPWTVLPDWGDSETDGVTERLSWKTGIMTSQTQVEQRRRQRNSPRMQMVCNFVLWGHKRQLFDSLMMSARGGDYRVPVWWEKYRIDTPLSVGDSIVNFDTSCSDIYVGTYMMLLGSTGFLYEVVKVAEVHPGAIVLVNTLLNAWPAKAAIYVTRRAQVNDDPETTRVSDKAITVSVTFDVMETNDYPALMAEVTSEPYPQFDMNPSYLDDITYTYVRVFDRLDNDFGIPMRRDPSGTGFIAQQYSRLIRGKADYHAFKQLLYFLQGKLQPFRMSSYFQDFTYLETATTYDTDNFIYVHRCGFAEYCGSDTPGRGYVSVELRNGSKLLNQVASAVLISDAVESIVFTSPWNTHFGPADIKRISFNMLMRQDQDDIEILHTADINGAATCTTTFVSLSDTARVATDYPRENLTGYLT